MYLSLFEIFQNKPEALKSLYRSPGYKKNQLVPGADPGFQVRWGALKKIAPSGGRRENFWGISCEKSRFYAKKHIFPILGGGARAGCAPPP